MYQLTYYVIPTLVTAIFSLIYALFFFIQSQKSSFRVLFGFVCSVSVLWHFGYAFAYASLSPAVALFWVKFAYIGVVFIPSLSYHFVSRVVGKENKMLITLGYVLTLIFLFLAFNGYLIEGVYKYFWGYHTRLNKGVAVPWFVFFFVYWMLTLSVLYFSFRKETSPQRRNQIKYVLFAWIFVTPACGDFLPDMGIPLFPIGYIPIMGFILSSAYATFKYHLMDIRVAITRAGIFLGVYSMVFVFPYYAGYLTESWVLSTTLALVLVIPATLMYRYFRDKTEELLFKKSRQYQRILSSSSEDILKYKDADTVIARFASLIFENVLPSFVAVFILENKRYALKILKPENISLPSKLELDHNLVETINTNRDVVHDFQLGDVLVPLVLPIGQDGYIRGILLLGGKKNKEMYSGEDLETFKTLLNQVSLALENIQHIQETVEEQREKDRLKKEMEMAKQIQQVLLPQVSPQSVEGLKIEGILLPAKEVAGDYYDFFLHDSQKVGLVVADISGKGMDAGMVMSMTKSALHIFSKQGMSPRDLVLNLNRSLCEQLRQQKFISLIYAEYTSTDNNFIWAGAGHEHIIIYRASNPVDIEVIKTGGIVLGMFEDIDDKITQKSVPLNKGDRIILYTDGATEARNPENEMFSLNRLVDTVKGVSGLPVKDLLLHIKDRVQHFIQDAPQYDDITLVVLGRD